MRRNQSCKDLGDALPVEGEQVQEPVRNDFGVQSKAPGKGQKEKSLKIR